LSHIDFPLIDIHTHVGHLPGVFGDHYSAEDLCYIAEHEGARYMLASSASTTSISESYGLAEAIAMVQQHGDRLGGMFWVNPRDPAWPEHAAAAAKHGFYGIKIHPALDNYAVEPAALEAVFACARERRWPILTHTGNDGTPISAPCYEPLIRAYPDVLLILAHLRVEAIPLAKRYDNVYLDTTYVEPFMVEVGVDAVGAAKILFGSDAAEGFDVGHAPGRVRPRRSYASLIDGLKGRGLSDAALEQILYANAQRVFGIGA
jgi:predicted TIM-barrel fold metal-dependent hydrolase